MSQLETMAVSLRRSLKWICLPVKPLERLWELKGKKTKTKQPAIKKGDTTTQKSYRRRRGWGGEISQAAVFCVPLILSFLPSSSAWVSSSVAISPCSWEELRRPCLSTTHKDTSEGLWAAYAMSSLIVR